MATSSSFRFDWRGASIAAQLEAAIEEASEQTAAAMQTTARGLARVDSGEMRDGLKATVEKRGHAITITLEGTAPHTIFNELGTSRKTAQPMIRPAIDAEAPKLAGRIKAAVARIR